MARSPLFQCDQATDDEYIDMDISSTTTFLCYSISPPHSSREFEFQMSSNPLETDSTTSPADELFYKGKLLPLQLPPRLQMVQMLLQTSNTSHEQITPSFEEIHTTPTAFTTPFESCNISPADSCNVSRELSPEEYFYECAASADNTSFMDGHAKKSWSRKLKLIKQSSLSLKLKASRAYFRSLFSKSGCSDESCADAARNSNEYTVSKSKECLNKYVKVVKKSPFGQIQRERYQASATAMSNEKEKMSSGEDGGTHRRSFSGLIKQNSGTKSTSLSSSSSSSSFSSSSSSYSVSSENSKGSYGMQLLKRSSSVNSEVESSIQGAIAHCKQSQQLFCTRKSVSDVGFGSLSASRSFENQEWPGMCRG